MKPKIKTYTIESIFGGCTKCDGEIVNQDGSFLLNPKLDEKIVCQDCSTEHSFPKGIFKIHGPYHHSFH